MINYIQHDAEFYGIIKLVSGEEILGTMIGAGEDGQTIIFVSIQQHLITTVHKVLESRCRCRIN